MKRLSSFRILYTDSTGAIEFSFTMPEALTKWKLQTLAHTKRSCIWLIDKRNCYSKTINGAAKCTKIFA